MSSCEQRCQYCKLWKVGWKKIEALQLSMLWHKPSKCIVPCSQITVKIATHVLKRIGRCFLPPPVASLAVPILSLGIEHWALTCYLFRWYWCHSWHPVIKLTLLSECSTASRPASQLLYHSHPFPSCLLFPTPHEGAGDWQHTQLTAWDTEKEAVIWLDSEKCCEAPVNHVEF